MPKRCAECENIIKKTVQPVEIDGGIAEADPLRGRVSPRNFFGRRNVPGGMIVPEKQARLAAIGQHVQTEPAVA